eukprot:929433-Rhodomonas_salina.1
MGTLVPLSSTGSRPGYSVLPVRTPRPAALSRSAASGCAWTWGRSASSPHRALRSEGAPAD